MVNVPSQSLYFWSLIYNVAWILLFLVFSYSNPADICNVDPQNNTKGNYATWFRYRKERLEIRKHSIKGFTFILSIYMKIIEKYYLYTRINVIKQVSKLCAVKIGLLKFIYHMVRPRIGKIIISITGITIKKSKTIKKKKKRLIVASNIQIQLNSQTMQCPYSLVTKNYRALVQNWGWWQILDICYSKLKITMDRMPTKSTLNREKQTPYILIANIMDNWDSYLIIRLSLKGWIRTAPVSCCTLLAVLSLDSIVVSLQIICPP